MASIPSRSRSLRKPTAGISQYDQSTALSSDMLAQDRVIKPPERRGAESPMRSPSRLPQPQERRGDESPMRSPSRLPQPPSSNIARPPRPGSSSSNNANPTIRPPPPRLGVSRPPLTSNNKTTSSRNGARTPTEPNSSRSVVSRPPLTADNKTLGFRSGARTPTESSSARSIISRPPLTSDNKTSTTRIGARTPTEPNTSLQRRPSVNARIANDTHNNSTSSTLALSSGFRPSNRSTHTRAASTVAASTVSSHTRATSSVSASATATIARPSSQQSQATFSNPNLSRPAFNTLQQHFSPLKSLAPKPATSTYLAPPSPSKLPSNQLISAETARLQAELLQLHLLHQSAQGNLRGFRQSAERKLQARFEDLQKRNEALMLQERELQGRRNAGALKLMGEDGMAGWGLEEKIQALDIVLAGVWNVSDGGGRYARVARKFERWIGGVEEVLERRKVEDENENGLGTGEIAFVIPMEESWREECEALVRKLEGWRNQLRDLGDVGGGDNSLSALVKGLNALVSGMQQELAAMKAIEIVVLRTEEEWIREAIYNGDGDESDEESTPGAIWRAY